MAKSKVGGSRAYITGRIGSDVYSLGKDGKGKRQQVVRSLAVEVANPRSQAQMFNRMIMSTVMQAVSSTAKIIDHAFDGLPKGQPSISEFIRLNYNLVKADAVAHPASDNTFGLNKYQEKGMKVGEWIIASGSAVIPAAVVGSNSEVRIALTADTLTVGGLKAALGLTADGYITVCYLEEGGSFQFIRFYLSTALADDTAIAAGNVNSLFTQEGTAQSTVELMGNNIVLFSQGESVNAHCTGVIISDKENGQWIHSNCQMKVAFEPAYTADDALPTYPVGSEQFLNGGDI